MLQKGFDPENHDTSWIFQTFKKKDIFLFECGYYYGLSELNNNQINNQNEALKLSKALKLRTCGSQLEED